VEGPDIPCMGLIVRTRRERDIMRDMISRTGLDLEVQAIV
jgi:hypothetical protein